MTPEARLLVRLGDAATRLNNVLNEHDGPRWMRADRWEDVPEKRALVEALAAVEAWRQTEEAKSPSRA